MIFNIFTEIRNWAIERGIYDKGYNHKAEVRKDIEETFELIGYQDTDYLVDEFVDRYYIKSLDPTEDDIVDSHCDKVVFAINAIEALGYDAQLCMSETIAEISSRKGSINEETGKWEKNRDQDPRTLYTANYQICKRMSEE
jgi:hypothetical protein